MYIVQKLGCKRAEGYERAYLYYSLLSLVGSMGLVEREVQFLAHIATGGDRRDFVEKFGSSMASVNNLVSRLKKKRLLVKEGKKLKVNSLVGLDFNKPIILRVSIDV